jgi:hypothetical protein
VYLYIFIFILFLYEISVRPEDAGSLQPQITTCGNTIPWDEVSPRYRDLFENIYGPACQECKVNQFILKQPSV